MKCPFVNMFTIRQFRRQGRYEYRQKRETTQDMRSKINFLMEYLAQEQRIIHALVDNRKYNVQK